MRPLRLKEIWIYPVKALGGIRVSSSRVMEKGLPFDRRWMLIDEANTFMTQRLLPELALFKVAIDSQALQVTHRAAKMQIALESRGHGEPIKATIWNDTVEVMEVDPETSAWFSEQLSFSCRLVSFPEGNSRHVEETGPDKRGQVSLADAYPFLIIGEESLADLNSKMERKLPMNRFRPNLVFEGGEPFEEDTWKDFRIGKNRFVGIRPCGRCAVPTIDQETAEKGIEPLLTLSRYRKQGAKVYFGQNVVALDHEEIFEGDEIVVG